MEALRTRILKYFLLFLITLLFYTAARLEFLLWNYAQFSGREGMEILWAFVVGLRFDLSAVAYMGLLPFLLALIPWNRVGISLLWQDRAQWLLFVTLQTPMVVLSLVDTAYVDFVGRRFTWDTLFMIGEVQGQFWGFFAPFMGLFLVNTCLVGLFLGASWKGLRWLSRLPVSQVEGSVFLKGGRVLVWGLLPLLLLVIAARGGLQKKPMGFVHANVFDVPILNNLVLNSTFTVLKSYGAEKLARTQYFADMEQVQALLNGGLAKDSSLKKAQRPTAPQNVVIVLLESFGSEYTGIGGAPSYTPFLDELAQKSLFFPRSLANGRRSIEGVAAVMAGIPALMSEPFISSSFASNYFLGLGTLLGKAGYSTAFFHGGNNGTMYFDTFMKSAGVEKYFGANEYPHSGDHDGVWGIWDEPFLAWSVDQISQIPQPFLASVFTLSSHQPFQVPAKYKEKYPEGPLPILKSVKYADDAFRQFMEKASLQPWYKDTLFVITADHASMHFRPEFESELGNYEVPLMFYHPAMDWPEVDRNQAVGQIDILPSILDFLGLPELEKNYLGRSVFVNGERAVVNYIDGRYLIATDQDWLLWSPWEGAPLNKKPLLYSRMDRAGKTPIEDRQRQQILIEKIKAHIQYFSSGMWDNRLYFPGN